MTTQNSNAHMQVTQVIDAPRPAVYQALLDPAQVAQWLAPGEMTLHAHKFEPHVGGQFRISLRYPAGDAAARGKSGGDLDTYHGYFAELIPNEKVVEVIEFETTDPGLRGEMTMTVTLADAPGDGTEVTFSYDNLPSGVRPEDNELGTRESLKKLAALLARG